MATIGTTIRLKNSTFGRRVPRRVPGRDLGSILGGFGRDFCVFLIIFYICFGLSFSSAFYMGCVWNVYEVGMAYALILDEYWIFLSYSMSVVEVTRQNVYVFAGRLRR